jgi:hypothetical protein
MQTTTNLNSPIVWQALAGTVANFGGLYHEAVTNLAANLFTISNVAKWPDFMPGTTDIVRARRQAAARVAAMGAPRQDWRRS